MTKLTRSRQVNAPAQFNKIAPSFNRWDYQGQGQRRDNMESVKWEDFSLFQLKLQYQSLAMAELSWNRKETEKTGPNVIRRQRFAAGTGQEITSTCISVDSQTPASCMPVSWIN